MLCANENVLCIPSNYSKFELPQENANTIRIGIDIKDITKIDEKESTITMTAYFIVKWIDMRIIFNKVMPCPFKGPKMFCAAPIFLS